jgi:hypothetical protein
MYCPQCGTTNEDTAAFCKSCGTDLKKYKEQWADPAGANEPTETGGTPPSSYPPPYPQQPQPTYQTPPYQAGPGYQQPPAYPQPGAYQQPGYQQAPYQPGPGYGLAPNIPSYMGWAIVTLILCFWPTGIAAVVFAARVGNRLALGDISGAQEASRKAKMWCWITFGIGIAWIIIAVIAIVVAAAAVSPFYY